MLRGWTILALLLTTAAASADTTLRFRWKPGQTLTYSVQQTTTVTETTIEDGTNKPVTAATKTTLALTRRWEVKGVDATGTATLEMATLGILTFIGSWNDLWGPLIYLHDERLFTMPLGLLHFVGTAGRAQGSPWHMVMAVSTVMMVPIVVVFFLAQKRFIEGIATSGVKG